MLFINSFFRVKLEFKSRRFWTYLIMCSVAAYIMQMTITNGVKRMKTKQMVKPFENWSKAFIKSYFDLGFLTWRLLFNWRYYVLHLFCVFCNLTERFKFLYQAQHTWSKYGLVNELRKSFQRYGGTYFKDMGVFQSYGIPILKTEFISTPTTLHVNSRFWPKIYLKKIEKILW